MKLNQSMIVLLLTIFCLGNRSALATVAVHKQMHKHSVSHASAAHATHSRVSAGLDKQHFRRKVAGAVGQRRHLVTEYRGKQRRVVAVAAAHHGRHHKGQPVVVVHAPKTHYAYPLSLFMIKPPEFDRSPFSPDLSSQVQSSFNEGCADVYPAHSLVRAGIVNYHPLHGGIFWRREPVKYIILHSTETGVPQSAPRVIESWGSMGRRHPGAQYVVDRDGSIYQAVDPDLATVHVNIFKTLPGINNDNSIGIEMCHTGHQEYPLAQTEAMIKLVAYLQDRYKISDENVVTHRYAQQGDHTDPVSFDLENFLAQKNHFRSRAIAYKLNKLNQEAASLPAVEVTTAASTYLQPHQALPLPAPSLGGQNATTFGAVPPASIKQSKVLPKPAPSFNLLPPASAAESVPAHVAPLQPLPADRWRFARADRNESE